MASACGSAANPTLAFRETFEALVCGLQDACWRLGGDPEAVGLLPH